MPVDCLQFAADPYSRSPSSRAYEKPGKAYLVGWWFGIDKHGKQLTLMIFREKRLKGVFEIELTTQEDERGFFARSYCEREFQAHGLNPHVAQCNLSYNRHRGTLRGMHYQVAPNAEAKLIRCVRGALYDVVIDLRVDSPTFGQWTAVELRAETGKPSRMLYVPEGFAHGFQTLEDDTEVFYQMSEFFASQAARGFRWNDPAFGVEWPEPVQVMSDRDRTYPDFDGTRPKVAS